MQFRRAPAERLSAVDVCAGELADEGRCRHGREGQQVRRRQQVLWNRALSFDDLEESSQFGERVSPAVCLARDEFLRDREMRDPLARWLILERSSDARHAAERRVHRELLADLHVGIGARFYPAEQLHNQSFVKADRRVALLRRQPPGRQGPFAS